jgi:L-asparaginase
MDVKNDAGDLPLVRILATGGTIANTPTGRLGAGEVAAAIPGLERAARLEIEEVARLGSSNIGVGHWLQISNRINEIFATVAEVKGVVITHGSNTVEETAYFLNLTVKSGRAVVLTAAQRELNTLSSDGPRNFLQAVRVAACDEAAGKGALVVTNDVINAAREVTKTLSYRLETYNSRDLGALGFVDEDRITFYRAPLKKHTTATPFDVRGLATLPRVDILYTYADADGVLVKAAVELGGAAGLIIAGFPTGSPTPAMEKAILEVADRGVPVAMAHRGGAGRVRLNKRRRPYIWADNLTPQKARILLMLGLTRTDEPDDLQEIFERF